MFGFHSLFSIIMTCLSWLVYLYAFAFFLYFIMMNWMAQYLSGGFGQFLATICDPLVKLFNIKATISNKEIQFSPLIWALILNFAWQIFVWLLTFIIIFISYL